MSVNISFLGASGTVTGSKYLVEHGAVKILVDAGLFQGNREERERNWDDPGFDASKITSVLLTHAHIDHLGILPRFVAKGLKARVYASKATTELAHLLLPDSAYLQEEEAAHRLKYKRSRHDPPLPLYTGKDAEDALKLFHSIEINKRIEVADSVYASWQHMGHILGACSIQLEIGGKKITFSGDVGRYSVPIMKDPEPVEFGDLLLIESTYGNREHPILNPKEALSEIINKTTKRGGITLIPSFAVGRAQLLLYYIRELKEEGKIPDIPVIIDSPMARDATGIYNNNPDSYDEEALQIKRSGRKPFSPSKLHFIQDREESKKLNGIDEPMILISASGMMTGGRILHHLFHRVGDPRNTVLIVGFQPPGGRGDWLRKQPETMRLLGQEVTVRAQVEEISAFSAHGDRSELLRWCKESKGKPKRVAVVHGTQDSADAFSKTLSKELDWDAFVPKYKEKISI